MKNKTNFQEKFIKRRVLLVDELQEKMYERSKLNKEIRKIQSELNAWDRTLIQTYKEDDKK